MKSLWPTQMENVGRHKDRYKRNRTILNTKQIVILRISCLSQVNDPSCLLSVYRTNKIYLMNNFNTFGDLFNVTH